MASKKSRTRFQRKVGIREGYETFLIICEGEKTEPYYFKSFEARATKIVVKGIGYNTVSLVREAEKLKTDEDYDQVWCVFDKDSFSAQQVEEALKLAKRNGIKAAFSNEAFELWYLLHFDYLDSAISRNRYCDMLTERLGFRYEKNRPDMYQKLEKMLDNAVRNAVRLLESYNRHRPAHDNPCTTVHKLVLQLKKNIRK